MYIITATELLEIYLRHMFKLFLSCLFKKLRTSLHANNNGSEKVDDCNQLQLSSVQSPFQEAVCVCRCFLRAITPHQFIRGSYGFVMGAV